MRSPCSIAIYLGEPWQPIQIPLINAPLEEVLQVRVNPLDRVWGQPAVTGVLDQLVDQL